MTLLAAVCGYAYSRLPRPFAVLPVAALCVSAATGTAIKLAVYRARLPLGIRLAHGSGVGTIRRR